MKDRTERARLQVVIPASTVHAVDITAQAAGASRAATVDFLLNRGLRRDPSVEDIPWWEPPTPPKSKQVTFAVPAPLADWIRSQPGTMSAKIKFHLFGGIELEHEFGCIMYPPPTSGEWKERNRVNVRVPPDLWGIVEVQKHQRDMTWTQVAVTYMYNDYLHETLPLPLPPPVHVKTPVPEPLVAWLNNQALTNGLPPPLQTRSTLLRAGGVTLYQPPTRPGWNRMSEIEIALSPPEHTEIKDMAAARTQPWTQTNEINSRLYSVYRAETRTS